MELMEHIYNKQKNQLNEYDMEFLQKNKQFISRQITHIMDCEAYSVDRRFIIREISIYNMRQKITNTYHICYLKNEIPKNKSKIINYQIYRIHGLRVIRYRKRGYVTLSEFDDIFRHTIPSDSFVAYKGGTIERDFLARKNVKSINIEILDCPKYEVLMDRYEKNNDQCGEHINGVYHCSRYEVCLFADYVKSIYDE